MVADLSVHLVGTEYALAFSAAFLGAHWPFETPAGRQLIAQLGEKKRNSLYVKVSGQWRDLQAKAGLWRPGDPSLWTQESMRRKAELRGSLRLTTPEFAHLRLAVKASLADFARDWREFEIVVPEASMSTASTLRTCFDSWRGWMMPPVEPDDPRTEEQEVWMPDTANRYRDCLRDLVLHLCRVGAEAEVESRSGRDAAFNEGRAAAYREVLNSIKNHAGVFEISEDEIGVGGFDPLLGDLSNWSGRPS